jgi:hypothetical protein
VQLVGQNFINIIFWSFKVCNPRGGVPYRLYITAQKARFLPCGVTARTKNIYLFWGCGIEKRGFLAYFGACQAKIPVRGWCKLNISRVRG